MLDRIRNLLSRSSQTKPAASDSPPTQHRPAPKSRPAQTLQGMEIPANESPQAYLARVQAKTHKLAEEFAGGEINRAQFQELFSHYRREIQTIEGLLDLEDQDEAWKQATTEGQSVLIRHHYSARALGYAIYENDSGMPLNTIGHFEVDPDLAVPMLSSYRTATREIFGAGMRSTEIEGGRWMCYVPGEQTTLMALFSTEPATRQLKSLDSLHRLFEQANRNLLAKQPVDPESLVFPHVTFLGKLR